MKSSWSKIALLLPKSSSSKLLLRDWGFVWPLRPASLPAALLNATVMPVKGVWWLLLSSYQLVWKWSFCAINAFQWMLRELCTGLNLRWNQLVNFQLFHKRWKKPSWESPLPCPQFEHWVTCAIKIQRTLSKSVTWIFKGRQMGFHFHDISVQFSSSVLSDSLWPNGLQHARPPCPSPTPGAYSNSCPSNRWCHPTISSSVIPFSCLQSFPASGSFQRSQFFASGGLSIGVSASASVLPMNIQDWSPLGWTGWISLKSKRLSRVFSNTTVQKHQLFGVQLSL